MTVADLAALACEDCLGLMHVHRGQGIGGPVLAVVVEHEPTCPWLARVAPQGATVSGAFGVLTHRARDTAAATPGVGDER